MVYKYNFIRCVNFFVSQFQTQQMMTSQIRSQLEYLVQTYHIFCAHSLVEISENLAMIAGFNTI